jgi:hypothetical protein
VTCRTDTGVKHREWGLCMTRIGLRQRHLRVGFIEERREEWAYSVNLFISRSTMSPIPPAGPRAEYASPYKGWENPPDRRLALSCSA